MQPTTSMAFHGTMERLGDPNNGPFLGLMEMLAKFDPTTNKYINQIKNGEKFCHYLGHQIQNKLIELMAPEARKILEKVKKAKYFAGILDCTSNVCHHIIMQNLVPDLS